MRGGIDVARKGKCQAKGCITEVAQLAEGLRIKAWGQK